MDGNRDRITVADLITVDDLIRLRDDLVDAVDHHRAALHDHHHDYAHPHVVDALAHRASAVVEYERVSVVDPSVAHEY